jgi:uncharacterized protein Yka (UPF0111/DUF47 family)
MTFSFAYIIKSITFWCFNGPFALFFEKAEKTINDVFFQFQNLSINDETNIKDYVLDVCDICDNPDCILYERYREKEKGK